MNGPSAARMTSACAAPNEVPRASVAAMAMPVNLIIVVSVLSAVFCERRPGREPAVDPLLQFNDDGAHHRQHDQTRKYLLGFHDLAGVDQEIAHATLAR